MKKIAFLISGNIRIYEKNLVFFEEIKKILRDFEIIIVSSIWENQEDLENFKEKYKIKFINQIEQKNCNDNIKNFQVLVEQKNDQLLFSHKIEKGGSSKSYGIEAAKLAGVPKEVIEKARKVLNSLEKNNNFNNEIKIK